MADRYWVGGTANWDGTAGTKWSATSGGAGGASVPTTSDDVFFDAASTGTVTIASGNTGAKSINCTGFTGTLTGNAAISVAGSITLDAGMTYSYTGTITITGTGTLTSAGKTMSQNITINGSGITVTLGDALTISNSSAIIVFQGTFTTNNYNFTGGQLSSTGASVRAINLGSSTVTLRFNTPVNFTTTSNLTFNAGTSTIIVDSSANTFNGGTQSTTGVTFYNVTFNIGNINGLSINGRNTFNDLTLKGSTSSAGLYRYAFKDNQVINGTFSSGDTDPVKRVLVSSSTSSTSTNKISYTLTLNGSVSISDVDFENIFIIGTSSPISGTRIGDMKGTYGITFSSPKTVYLVGNTSGWAGNGGANWAASSGAAGAAANFPLPQDTAVIDQSSPSSISMSGGPTYFGTLDSSSRTSAFSISFSADYLVYGSIVTGSGISYSNNRVLYFLGRSLQTITSAGKTLNQAISIISYGGTVELTDALNLGQSFSLSTGTFDTKGYNLTCSSIGSGANFQRTINLGSSTVTITAGVSFDDTTNLTFNAGTSTITSNATTFNLTVASTAGSGVTFYNVTSTSTTSSGGIVIQGNNTFNNVTITNVTSNGYRYISFRANQTINGTLNCAGASEVRRIRLISNTLGSSITLTVNTLTASNCDFRDITIAGTAAGGSPAGAGDAGNNSGITFPAAKTVYWNLAGSNNWDANAWASASGGSPAVANFPLAQDTCVFDDAGSAGTVSFNYEHFIGTLNCGSRTSAMTFSHGGQSPVIYGNFTLGTGVTITNVAGSFVFSGRGTQTITSNGVQFGVTVNISKLVGSVELADAISIASGRILLHNTGVFDAKTYNVTAGIYQSNSSSERTLRMGSGLWTLSGTGTVWNMSSSNMNFNPETADITLSDTSSSARTFTTGGLSYNKLTIGGSTGTSTLTLNGAGIFKEIASTKTVAHSIIIATSTIFGKWSVSGTSGNVVTISGGNFDIYGPATSGIDYLVMGSIGVFATSPGEFYAGANSTGTAAAPNFRTAAPAARTLYWVGGTGNWDNTARWSLSSGGSGGEAIPTSFDDVIFDSSSNATAYTVTINVTARCKSINVSGPASGNVTLSGTSTLIMHDDLTIAATGVTWSYTGTMIFSGTGSGKTITTNGVTLTNTILLRGYGAEWSLGSALTATNRSINVSIGTIDFDTYNSTFSDLSTSLNAPKTIDFGSGTMTVNGTTAIGFPTTTNESNALTVIAGASQINVGINATSGFFNGSGKTFYNVSFTGTSKVVTIRGSNTFNNLSSTARVASGVSGITFEADQTINGTLTLNAGPNATAREFLRSSDPVVQRTLTCNAVAALTDVDFRNIAIAGAAVSGGNLTGTRLGDCTGNSGITFTAGANKYWNLAAGGNWYATAWATSSGGAVDVNNFPLAQDTAFIESSSPNSGTTITVSVGYNIGNIDMSGRTTNTLTFTHTLGELFIYGNFVNGTGVTFSGTADYIFSGNSSASLTTAGVSFNNKIVIQKNGASLTLQDALSMSFTSSSGLRLDNGTFDASTYNVTLTNSNSFASSNTNSRTLAIGSGTWTMPASSTAWNLSTSSGITVTGTGTIKFTSSSSKTFNAGSISYDSVTIDQAGSGALSIVGNNKFGNITNSYGSTGATSIVFASSIQKVDQFTASGSSGNLLSISGPNENSFATIIYTGTGNINVDYISAAFISVYPA